MRYTNNSKVHIHQKKMSDSWDDENFEIPPLPLAQANSLKIPANWEDDEEEDLLKNELNQKVLPSKPSAAAIEAAERKAREDEIALQTKIKLSMQENETIEERRAREKKQVEESDTNLAGELFGSKKEKIADTSSVIVPKGIASTTLKTKQDHQTFGITVAQKLSDSSAFNIVAFYKSLSKSLESRTINSESIEEILSDIKRIKDEKLKLEKPAKQATTKKSKKEILEVEKKHGEMYGNPSKNSKLEKYDHYADMEDD